MIRVSLFPADAVVRREAFNVAGLRCLARFAPLFFFLFSVPSFLVPAVSPLYLKPTKKIALTFDDGPWPARTRRLREVLTRHNVRATFFIVGKVAARFPHVVRALDREGHWLANHTWSHPRITSLTVDQLAAELEATKDLIQRLTGKETWLFRPSGSTEHYLRKRFVVPPGFELVLWDVHSLDIEGLSAAAIVERVESQVEDGDVIIFHNGKQTTVEALDCLIPALKSYGFEFVSLDRLMQTDYRRILSAAKPTIIRG